MSETKRVRIPADAKIFINTDHDGPARRPNSKVGKAFAEYKDGMTVAEWLAAVEPLGAGMANLRKDWSVGRVIIEMPETEAAAEAA